MASFLQGKDVRLITYGKQIIKASQALPQTATATLYTVAGGNVLITSLYGLVSTTPTGSTVTTLSLGTVPTTGTAAAASIASTTAITSLEVGTWVTPQASSGKGGALVVGANAGATLYTANAFIVPPGTITWTTSAGDTGQMTWYLTYVALDDGASVS